MLIYIILLLLIIFLFINNKNIENFISYGLPRSLSTCPKYNSLSYNKGPNCSKGTYSNNTHDESIADMNSKKLEELKDMEKKLIEKNKKILLQKNKLNEDKIRLDNKINNNNIETTNNNNNINNVTKEIDVMYKAPDGIGSGICKNKYGDWGIMTINNPDGCNINSKLINNECPDSFKYNFDENGNKICCGIDAKNINDCVGVWGDPNTIENRMCSINNDIDATRGSLYNGQSLTIPKCPDNSKPVNNECPDSFKYNFDENGNKICCGIDAKNINDCVGVWGDPNTIGDRMCSINNDIDATRESLYNGQSLTIPKCPDNSINENCIDTTGYSSYDDYCKNQTICKGEEICGAKNIKECCENNSKNCNSAIFECSKGYINGKSYSDKDISSMSECYPILSDFNYYCRNHILNCDKYIEKNKCNNNYNCNWKNNKCIINNISSSDIGYKELLISNNGNCKKGFAKAICSPNYYSGIKRVRNSTNCRPINSNKFNNDCKNEYKFSSKSNNFKKSLKKIDINVNDKILNKKSTNKINSTGCIPIDTRKICN